MAAACASHSPAPALIPPPISPPILPLIPPLPDDVSIACLARLSLWDLAVVRCVSRGWAAAIASDSFAQQRRRQQALGAQRVRVVARHGEECGSCASCPECAECPSSLACCSHGDARDCTTEGRGECDINGVNGYVCLCAASRRHPGRLDWFAFDLSAPARDDDLPPASAASAFSAASAGSSKGTRWTFSGSACNESRRSAEGAGSSCSSSGSRFRLSACGRSGCGGLSGSNGYGRWRRLPPIPPSNPHGSQRCRHFSVAAIPGWGLAIAGGVVLGTGEAVRHVSLFDWLAGRWVQVQHEGFSARLDPVVVWAGGRLFVGGGGEIGGRGKVGGRGNVWGAGMGGVQGRGGAEGEMMRCEGGNTGGEGEGEGEEGGTPLPVTNPTVTTSLHPSISPRSCDIICVANRVYARYRHRLTCFADHPTSPSAAPATAGATGRASGAGCVLQLDVSSGRWGLAPPCDPIHRLAAAGLLALIPSSHSMHTCSHAHGWAGGATVAAVQHSLSLLLLQGEPNAPPCKPPCTACSRHQQQLENREHQGRRDVWREGACVWEMAVGAAGGGGAGGEILWGAQLKQVVVAGGRLFALVLLVDRGRHVMREMGVHGRQAGVVGPGIELPGEAYVAHAVGLLPPLLLLPLRPPRIPPLRHMNLLEGFFSTVGPIRKCSFVAQPGAALNALLPPACSPFIPPPPHHITPSAARGVFLHRGSYPKVLPRGPESSHAVFIPPTSPALASAVPSAPPLNFSSQFLLSPAPLICSSHLPLHLSSPPICPPLPSAPPICSSHMLQARRRIEGWASCNSDALAEDAERAVRELGGKRLEGRPLAVELAKRRASLGERLAKRGPRPQAHQVEDQDDLTGLHGLGRSNVPDGAGRRSGGATDVMGRRIPTRITTFPTADADAPAAPPPSAAAPGASPHRTVVLGGLSSLAIVAHVLTTAAAVAAREEVTNPFFPVPPCSFITSISQASPHGGVRRAYIPSRTRTVVFGGLSSPAAVAHVLSAAAAIAAPEEVTDPLPEDALKERGLALDGCTSPALSVVFPSVRAARQAVASLHGCTVGGGTETGGSEQSVTVWARQLGGEGSKSLSNRVIVRNLPFKVAEADLRKAFAVAGFPWAVKIPHGEDGRPRGFAFVTFTTKSDAAKAVEKVNGTAICGRAVSVGWAVAKREHMESVAKEKAKENRDGLSMLFDDEDDEMNEGGEDKEDEEEGEDEEGEEEDDEEEEEEEVEEMEEEEEEDDERKARVNGFLDMEAEEEDEEDEEEVEDEDESEEGEEEEEEGEEEGEEGEEDEEDGTDDEEEEVDWEMEMGGGGSSGAVQGSEKDMMLRVLSRVVEQGKGEEGMGVAGEEVGLKAKGVAVKGGKEGDAGRKGKEGKGGKDGKAGKDWEGKKGGEEGKGAAAGKKTGSRDGKEEGTGVEEGEVTEGKDGKEEKAEAPPATVFVRNLPVDASADRIRAAFERFGKVADCRVVLHPVTRRPRGSAFVRFETHEAAQAAVAGSARTAKARAEAGGEGRKGGVEEGMVVVGGQQTLVTLAVRREEVSKVVEKRKQAEQTGKGREEDRRNLQLLEVCRRVQ
ncbi:unnamed protein product, partial [Closterium sp. Naga37s-1]